MGLFGKKEKKKIAVVSEAPAGEALNGVSKTDDKSELIAVIAAAVAAYEAEQYRQALYIRKINRTAGTRPAWGIEGMMEAQDVRRI